MPYALPIDLHAISAQDTNHLLIHARDTATGTGCHERTVYAIIWSCIVTIFACIWSAMHHNIPSPDDKRWSLLKERILMMAISLVAPEFIILNATVERYRAWKIAKQYNEMFMNEFPPTPSYQDKWVRLALTWLASAPQSLWSVVRDFIADSPVAAYYSGHDELWTTTHGFFVLMGGFHLYDGQSSPRVLKFEDMCTMIKRGDIDKPTLTEMEILGLSKRDAVSKAAVILQASWFVVQCLARLASGLPLSQLEVVTLGYAVLNGFIYGLWWNKPQGAKVPVRVYLKSPKNEPPGNKGETAEVQETSIPKEITPKEYFRKVVAEPWDPIHIPMYVTCATGTLFGAVHFFGWNSMFPSRAEQIAWRITVPLITAAPLIFVLCPLVDANSDSDFWLIHVLTFIPWITTVVLYILARIVVLTLAFLSLRALSPQVFDQVTWTSFIPHL